MQEDSLNFLRRALLIPTDKEEFSEAEYDKLDDGLEMLLNELTHHIESIIDKI